MSDCKFNIVELYTCVSGEEPTSGLPTSIVRFSGCNLNCWPQFGGCDTPNRCSKGDDFTVDEMLEKIENLGMPHVLVTGGEPLLHGHALPLLRALSLRRTSCVSEVSVETNGSIDVTGVPGNVRVVMDVKCPSSCELDVTLLDNICLMGTRDVLKFVIGDLADFEYTQDVVGAYLSRIRVSGIGVVVSPLWGVCDPKDLIAWLNESHLLRSIARMQLQIHKVVYGGMMKLV